MLLNFVLILGGCIGWIAAVLMVIYFRAWVKIVNRKFQELHEDRLMAEQHHMIQHTAFVHTLITGGVVPDNELSFIAVNNDVMKMAGTPKVRIQTDMKNGGYKVSLMKDESAEAKGLSKNPNPIYAAYIQAAVEASIGE